MNQKHLRKEDLVDLYYEPASAVSSKDHEHLKQCEDCRREYESIAAVLNLSNRLSWEPLSSSQNVRMFEQAWADSRKRVKTPWSHFFISWLRRPALTFVLGVLCGLSGVIFLAEKNVASSQTVVKTNSNIVSEPKLRMDSFGSVQTLQGEIVKKMYPQVENPVLMVEESSNQSGESHRVLYGTVDNGKVKIVWNM